MKAKEWTERSYSSFIVHPDLKNSRPVSARNTSSEKKSDDAESVQTTSPVGAGSEGQASTTRPKWMEAFVLGTVAVSCGGAREGTSWKSSPQKEDAMLVLTRKLNQKILIDGGIVVTVVRIDRNQIRLGIEAPSNMRVVREELAGGSQSGSSNGAVVAGN
jgi:carbon storage regulator